MQQHIDNLKILRTLMQSVPQDQIDMNSMGWDDEHQTWSGPRCMLGHAITHPDFPPADKNGMINTYSMEHFGVTYDYLSGDHLFGWNSSSDKADIDKALSDTIDKKEKELVESA